MANQQSPYAGLRELALFAGAGGGILGGHLLGWRTVCAVEYEPYPASVLLARQNDGILPPFPIWDDVRTFDGKPWRGLVDVVSGGFPCQDISIAGAGAGLDGERSGLWSEMARIIGEVRPRYAFIENSPMLTVRGLDRVLCDLAALGYDAEWGVLSAADLGAHHVRERIWLLAHSNVPHGQGGAISCGVQQGKPDLIGRGGRRNACEVLANSTSIGQQGQGEYVNSVNRQADRERKAGDVVDGGVFGEWPPEPGMGRVVDGMAGRSNMLKAIGNGQVPRVAAAAFDILARRLAQ